MVVGDLGSYWMGAGLKPLNLPLKEKGETPTFLQRSPANCNPYKALNKWGSDTFI